MGNGSTKKERIDALLVIKGLVESRAKAQAIVMAGSVFVDGQRVDKPGTRVNEGSLVEVRGKPIKYVSRGGLKLEAALREFGITPDGLVAIDVGASTGGFTDCLLQHGAVAVHCLDVGRGQLDWTLRNDPRVKVREKFNARYLKPEDIGERVDIAVVDVSFISLKKIIPPLVDVLKPGGRLVALIKPQFEVGRGEVGKGGIVKDPEKHRRVVDEITALVSDLGFDVIGVIPSPILGAEGNKEFLIAAVLKN